MSDIKKQIDETSEELAKEEFSPKQNIRERTYDAAKRRIDKDNIAKLAIIISFVGTIFAAMAISYLNEQKILTAEGAILIIGGGLLYVGFRMFVLMYNFLSLKLQKTAIEMDIKEAKVRRTEAETDAYTARESRKVEEDKLLFLKNQARLDRKLDQDLTIRGPFFQDAQKGMMEFFAREDIVEALQVPPTFVEAVERLDDALLKRSSFDITAEKMNARMTDIMVQYDNMAHKTKENNELLTQLIQRDAELVVKWRETDVGLKQVQKQVASLSNSIDTLMEMFSESLNHKNTDKPDPPKSLTQELDELVETKGVSSGPSQVMIDKMAEEDMKAVEKEDEPSTLSPPPRAD